MECQPKGPRSPAQSPRRFPPGKKTRPLLALAGYGLITLFLLHPHEKKLRDHLPQDLGDPLQTCWMSLWQIDRFESGFDSYFTTNAFHPYRGNLAFTDYQPLMAVLLWPLFRLSGNIVLAYNLLYYLAFILSGWTCYLLARRWFEDEIGAFLAGIVFAYCGYRIDHLAHLQLLWCPWIPLALLAASTWFESGKFRYALWLALLVVLQAATSVYYFFYLVLAVCLLAGCWVLISGRRPLYPVLRACPSATRVKRRAAFIVLLPGLFLAVCLSGLLFIPYLKVQREYGFQPEFIDRFSATLASFWTAPWCDWLHGGLTKANRRGETNYMIGFTVVALLCCNFLRGRPEGTKHWRTPRWAYAVLVLSVAGAAGLFYLEFLPRGPWSVRLLEIHPLITVYEINLFVFIALSVFLLAYGPFRSRIGKASIVSVFILILAIFSTLLSFRQPAHYLSETIPLLSFLRTPGRIGVLIVLAVALGAASGYRALAQKIVRPRMAPALGSIFAIALLAEYSPGSFYSVPFSVDPQSLPPIYEHLASLDRKKEVLLELPMDHIFYDTRASVYSIFHHLPTVNGQSAYMPRDYLDFMSKMNRRFPSVETVRWIRERGVTLVTVHYEYLPVAKRSALDPGGAESSQAREWRIILQHLDELKRIGEFGAVDLFRVVEPSKLIELAAAEIAIHCRDGRTSAPLDHVYFKACFGPEKVLEGWDREGTWRMRLQPGGWWIQALPRDTTLAPMAAEIAMGESTQELQWTFLPFEEAQPEPGRSALRLELLNPQGEHWHGVWVTVERADGWSYSDWSRDGFLQLWNVPPGTYRIRFAPEAGSCSPEEIEVFLEPDRKTIQEIVLEGSLEKGPREIQKKLAERF